MRRAKTNRETPPLVEMQMGAVLDRAILVKRVQGAARLMTVRLGLTEPEAIERGAIVRVVPWPNMTAAEKAALKERLVEHGARHVWFAPAMAGAKATVERDTAPLARGETVRQATAAMVEAARTADRERLTAVVEDAYARVGL